MTGPSSDGDRSPTGWGRPLAAAALTIGLLAAGWVGSRLWSGATVGPEAAGPVATGLPTDPTRPDRPARYQVCPAVDVAVGAGWELVDRELPALAAGMMGRHYTFRPADDGSGPAGSAAARHQQIEVATGVEVLDRYEDLDFTTEIVDVEGNEATLAAAGAFGTGDTLVVLNWSQPALASPCSNLSVVGTNVDRDELTELARLLARTVAVDGP